MQTLLSSSLALVAVALLTNTADAQTQRHYDCSKAGNANKAVCKAAAVAPAATPSPPTAPAAPATGAGPRIVQATQKNGRVVHYDCSKRGNLNKKACK